MHSITEITSFLGKQLGLDVPADADIVFDVGCWGDDFWGLMESYSKTFHVDMGTFLWYFHAPEEGFNLGAMFFKSPDQRVSHIPVTARMLLDFANKGRWDIEYPEHKLPKRRYDLLIGSLLFYPLFFILFLSIIVGIVQCHSCNR